MKRILLKQLIDWKDRDGRKPLMLRGARQVGKTYLLEHFGKNHFPQFHRINFEKKPKACQFFEIDLDPIRIIKELSIYLGVDINIKKDLLIFDEIQACPKAITSLKYFCEDLPELALCSAGSLLGIHLANTSWPVGKIELEYLNPMSFEEFLLALGDERYLDYLSKFTKKSLTAEPIHHHLWEQLKLYYVTGGLPEVISTYLKYHDRPSLAFEEVRKKQHELIVYYYADMAKHAGKVNAMHIERIWSSIPIQLARNIDGSSSKFQFKGVVPGVRRYQQLVGPIDWLEAAGLIIKVAIANSGLPPTKAYTEENKFKLMIFDIGILGALSDLSPSFILAQDYGSYKGYFAENFVAQEFQTKGIRQLYSWHEGHAEVEFLREIQGKIIPIEVKSGSVTRAKSLQSFSQKYHPPYKLIISGKPFAIDDKRQTHYYPLYMASRIPIQGNDNTVGL